MSFPAEGTRDPSQQAPAPPRQDERPFVSVIIPVYNDAVGLAKCLAALEGQTYPKEAYEVIVVDNASTESIAPLVSRYAQARATFESRSGSYAARNKGISLARGQIFAFTDADCLPSSDWLERGVAKLLAYPACGLVGGRIDVFCTGQPPTSVELYDSTRGLRQQKYIESSGFAATANVFTFRHIFDAVGLFDGEMKSSGDVEWARRVSAAGYKLVYADDARVGHPARVSLSQIYRKMIRVAGGKHDLSKRPNPKPSANPVLFKGFAMELAHIFRDSRLRTPGQRIKVASIMVFVESVKAYERVRLVLFGAPRR